MFKKIFTLIAFLLLVGLLVVTQQAKAVKNKTVAITQIVPHPSLDKIRLGIEHEILWAFGDSVKVEFQSAQGSASLAVQIAQNFVGKNVDVLVAITTPSAQAMMASNANNIPLVFAGVTDPVAAKLVNEDGSNKSNITGVSDAPAIDKQVALLQEKLPSNSRIGIIYNPGETNSAVHTAALEKALTAAGFTILKAPAYSTGDVLQAVQSIAANVDALMLTNDNTVIAALDAILQTAKNIGIPIFSSDPESVHRGCAACIAPDQYEMGRQAGKLVVKLLNGAKPESLPIVNAPVQRFENEMNKTRN
jgi:putative ABC transport system substrate-binding protein